MSSGFWIIAVLLTGLVGAFVLLPLLRRDPQPTSLPGRARGTSRQNQALDTLWTEKLRVLRAIRDLDFDYDMDKLNDTTYEAQRIDLLRLAAAITRRIDELEAEIARQDTRLEEMVNAFRRAN